MNQESRESIKAFTDLIAWKEAHQLAIIIYQMSKSFPRDELFGLTSQMRRCAVSISSNIAEGFSRHSYKEKIQFYSTSHGSTTELQSQLLIARDVGYIDASTYQRISNQSILVHKLLTGLIKASRTIILNS